MGIILGDNGTLQSISYGGGMIGEWGESKLLKSFTYTGSDQVYTIPEDGKYTFKVKGAGSNNAKGGYAEGTFTLTKGDKISVMVGQNGGSTSSATYGFGGSGNYGSDRAGGGLSGVFTGSTSITASDSARAMIIAGGAGGGKASGGAGGGETGGNGTKGSYGTAGGGGTQTGRNSGGNTGANQFNGGNGSGTYGSGGGGGWYGGNSSVGDSSGDDDSGSGGGSGYVLSTAEGRVLTQGGGADAKSNGSIEMYQSVKVYKGNVQKVMLGEVQVWPEGEPEPSSYDYSYNLLQKSVAQMKTDGWKFSREDYWETTTNGLHCTTSDGTAKFRTIGRDINLTDATKIVMEADVYSIQGSWNGFCGIQVFGQLDSQPVSTGGGWFCENNSSYNGYRVMSVGREVYNRTNVATGNYHIITTVDLVSKKISFTIGDYTTVETTMTDAEINTTRGYTLFGLYYDNVGCYVKNCSIHIEY